MLDKNRVIITNYETLQNADMLAYIREWRPEIVICDEAQIIKNPKAKRTKATLMLGDAAENRYFLTGTLILNSIKDVFAPFRFLDKGETFGKNFHVFTNTYMEDENAGWSNRPGYFPKLTARTDKYSELTDKIYTKATRVLKKDVLKDLPPLVKVKRSVELGKEQRKYYKEMERDFVTFVQEKKKNSELSGAVIAQLAITKALRLQQIATGYVSTEDGEEIFIQDNPRINAVEDILNEVVVNGKHKVILWCCFKANYIQLGDLCTKLGIKHVFLTGQQSLTEKQDGMEKFDKDSEVKVIIANRRAGGIGVNLVAASYSVVYSRNFSLGDELQSEARNHRGGSQIHERITKIDLFARETIDEHILEALNAKEDISKKVIDFVEDSVNGK